MSDFITNAYHSAKETVNDVIHETSLTAQTAMQRNDSQIIKERVENRVEALKREGIAIPSNLVEIFDKIQENHDAILARAEQGTSGTDARKDCTDLLTKQEKLEEKFNSAFATFTNNPAIKAENDQLKAQRELRDAEVTVKDQAQEKLDQAEAKYDEVSKDATDAANDIKNDATEATKSVKENIEDAIESVKNKFKA